MKRIERSSAVCIWVVVTAISAGAVLAGDYVIDWHTADGGGTMSSAGGSYALSGTIGQPDASAPAAMTGGSFALTGGFWVPLASPCTAFAPADFNGDCHVDAADLACMMQIMTGPRIPYNPLVVPGACGGMVAVNGILPADFDADQDIDESDFGVFQRCYSGSTQVADPNCAD